MPKKEISEEVNTAFIGGLLGTGCTILNLACSGNPDGGFPKGKYIYLVGDSSSGKSWLSLTCFAEAMRSEGFKNHRIILDDPEDGAMMDKVRYFGQTVMDRIESPKEDGECSHSIEEFYDNVENAIEAKTPFIYVLDSETSLASLKDIEKYDEDKKARSKGKDESGSYGTAKAKEHSNRLRIVRNKLKGTDSILIIISQTRDNIGFGSQFKPKTRGGGNALTFYSDLELWTSVKSSIEQRVKGKERVIGNLIRVKVEKNRMRGGKDKIEIPFYYSHGIDDLGASVHFLCEEGHWKRSGDKGKAAKKLAAPEFDFLGTEDDLIKKIEDEGRENELKELVTKFWNEIAEGCVVERKNKYT